MTETEAKSNYYRWGRYVLGLAILAAIILFFSSGTSVRTGVASGLDTCVAVIIPSLFPFMILCNFIVESGIVDILSKPFGWFSRKILRLPSFGGTVLLLSMIGGFPAGAVMINGLVRGKRLTPAQGKRMMMYCVGAGPAFTITAVGEGMFGSFHMGLLLFISQILATLLISIIYGLNAGKDPSPAISGSRHISQNKGLADSFVTAVSAAAESLFKICAFVVAFSAITALLTFSGLPAAAGNWAHRFLGVSPEVVSSAILGLLEVTQGCLSAAKVGGASGYALASIFLSCTGFSVLCQLLSATSMVKIPLLPFILTRLLHGAIALILFTVLAGLFPPAAQTISASLPADAAGFQMGLSGSPQACAMLLFLSAMLLYSVEKKR